MSKSTRMTGFVYAWPEGVPRNYDELVRIWKPIVEREVFRKNRVESNREDILQDVWLRLFNANFLEKFVQGAVAKLWPRTMKATDACAYLGISWEQWVAALRLARPSAKYSLVPVYGKNKYDWNARFLTKAIMELDVENPFRSRYRKRFRPKVPVTRSREGILTVRGFKAYLIRSVHNHFANWCRTVRRRYKEGLLPPTALMQTNQEGKYNYGVGDSEDGWESRVLARGLSSEDRIIIASSLRDALEERGYSLEDLSESVPHRLPDGRVEHRPTETAKKGLKFLDDLIANRDIDKAALRLPQCGWGSAADL